MSNLNKLYIMLNGSLYEFSRDDFLTQLQWMKDTIQNPPAEYLMVGWDGITGFSIQGIDHDPVEAVMTQQSSKPND